MKILVFLTALSTSLFATVNEPLRCEIFSGYRNDRTHWHLQDPGDSGALTYSELYRDVQYWENGLAFKVIHRDLTFFVRGAYGTFGKGTLFQSTPDQPRIRLSTGGWTADASGYFGYAVNLTADRTYKVLLIPIVGYGAHFEQLKPEHFRLSWTGFFLGPAFSVEPGGRVQFNGGYTYHFMHNKVHTAIQPSSLTMKTSSGGNKGHTGWAQMDFALNSNWRLGAGAMIHYFFTRVVDATLAETAQKFKLRWTALSGWAQLSREF